MNKLERFSTIFLIAGFISFVIAFVSLGIWPSLMTSNIPEDGGLPKIIPVEFMQYYSTVDEYQKGLLRGRDIYIKEGCWHCHSQYVRPVGSESQFYGLVSTPMEYENWLNRPQLFGTRRVGPDLTRQAGVHTNDWHFAHLYNPKSTVPDSIMPVYTWYFDETTDPPTPKADAIHLVAYLQNLGAWAKDVSRTVYDMNKIIMPPKPKL